MKMSKGPWRILPKIKKNKKFKPFTSKSFFSLCFRNDATLMINDTAKRIMGLKAKLDRVCTSGDQMHKLLQDSRDKPI